MTPTNVRLIAFLAISCVVVVSLAILVVAPRPSIPPLRATAFELDEPFEPLRATSSAH